MAEQFKKTYVSAHEFVESWEKEIYELTNMDYFIYLLINNLAGEIESTYLAKLSDRHVLKVHSDDVGTLAFNIGDGLQQFLEKTCFDTCTLNCPLCLSDPISAIEQQNRLKVLNTFPLGNSPCKTKEQCLSADILNFVVYDSMLDFYQFEKGILIDEKDHELVRFSEFVTRIILETIRNQGQKLLQKPNENATPQFDTLMKTDASSWDTFSEFEDEEELSEGEEWKLTGSNPKRIIEAFKQNYPEQLESACFQRLLDRFAEFLTEFLSLTQIEKLELEELKEFITIVAVNDLLAEKDEQLDKIIALFQKLVRFLDFEFGLKLEPEFQMFLEKEYPQIKRTYSVIEAYSNYNPLVNYLISSEAADPTLLDGFFEIISVSGNNAEVEDIHLTTRFKPLDISLLSHSNIKSGDILHMQLIVQDLGFRLAHLEMVYPSTAKKYLF